MDRSDKDSEGYNIWRKIHDPSLPERQKVSNFSMVLGLGNNPKEIVKANEELLRLKYKLEGLSPSQLTPEQKITLNWLREQYESPGNERPSIIQASTPTSNQHEINEGSVLGSGSESNKID